MTSSTTHQKGMKKKTLLILILILLGLYILADKHWERKCYTIPSKCFSLGYIRWGYGQWPKNRFDLIIKFGENMNIK